MQSAPRFLALAIALLALPLFACAEGTQTSGSDPAVAPASAPGSRVIAQIVTHDARIAILASKAGDGDLRVAVRGADGALVADGITFAELRARDAGLYEIVTSSFAVTRASAADDGERGKPTFVDATLDLGHLN